MKNTKLDTVLYLEIDQRCFETVYRPVSPNSFPGL